MILNLNIFKTRNTDLCRGIRNIHIRSQNKISSLSPVICVIKWKLAIVRVYSSSSWKSYWSHEHMRWVRPTATTGGQAVCMGDDVVGGWLCVWIHDLHTCLYVYGSLIYYAYVWFRFVNTALRVQVRTRIGLRVSACLYIYVCEYACAQ